MSDYTKYTKQEMQAYAIAKNIKENQIVIVGTGLPLIGASLAKRAVCPSCQRNSAVRRNTLVLISQRTTLHHWLQSIGRSLQEVIQFL